MLAQHCQVHAVSLSSGPGRIPVPFGEHHLLVAAETAKTAQSTNSSEETA